MNSVEVILVSGLVSFVFGTLSSIAVTKYRLNREEERRKSKEIEGWEDDITQELHNARHLLIDIMTSNRGSKLIDSSYSGSPDEYVHQHDSPKFKKLDEHMVQIERLSGQIPEKHSNMGYYLTEASRQYRRAPSSDMDHRDRWSYLRDIIEDAHEKIKNR